MKKLILLFLVGGVITFDRLCPPYFRCRSLEIFDGEKAIPALGAVPV
jgi:hypothetical protein